MEEMVELIEVKYLKVCGTPEIWVEFFFWLCGCVTCHRPTLEKVRGTHATTDTRCLYVALMQCGGIEKCCGKENHPKHPQMLQIEFEKQAKEQLSKVST
ncbi:hypothetical protein KKA15_05720 [Patescibacteria group bacterium]|nr:hypothetical protein [Patescibacteria group bacterium]